MNADLETTRCQSRRNEFSLLFVNADHAETEYRGDFISVGGLKTNGDFLFALHQRCGRRVFDIEEMQGPPFRWFAHQPSAFDQYVECPLRFIAIIANDEGQGMGGSTVTNRTTWCHGRDDPSRDRSRYLRPAC